MRTYTVCGCSVASIFQPYYIYIVVAFFLPEKRFKTTACVLTDVTKRIFDQFSLSSFHLGAFRRYFNVNLT